MSAYQLGASTIRQVQSSPELQLDKVDEVMSDLQDVMDTQQDIDNAMSSSYLSSDFDASAIEAELDAMMQSERVAPSTRPLSPARSEHHPEMGAALTQAEKEELALLEQALAVPTTPIVQAEHHATVTEE